MGRLKHPKNVHSANSEDKGNTSCSVWSLFTS